MIYLLYPTARVDLCVDVLKKWITSCSTSEIKVLIGVDNYDDKRKLRQVLSNDVSIYVTNPGRKGVTYPLYCLTSSLQYLHPQPKPEDLIIVVSDDFLPVKDNWDLDLKEQFDNFSGLLIQDDSYQKLKSNEVVTLPILTYQCLQKLNYILYHPVYYHMWSDVELYDIVKELNLMKDIREDVPSIFVHNHWVNGKRAKDELDNQVTNVTWRRDEIIYNSRKKLPAANKLTTFYKNVVCFSLWGEKEMYHRGAEDNIRLFAKLLPSFHCVFYIDKNLDYKYTQRLLDVGKEVNSEVEVIPVDKKSGNDGMFWRFEGADRSSTLVYLSRDTDSRLTQRELVAVKEWLSSDNSVHIMRDHPYHDVVMLGGLWGSRFRGMNGITEVVSQLSLADKEQKGCDQIFLAKHIYPNLSDDCYVHDEITKFRDKYSHTFSTERKDNEYVGEVYDEYGKPCQEFRDVFNNFEVKEEVKKEEEVKRDPTIADLLKKRANVYSQNGEDGLIMEILSRFIYASPSMVPLSRSFVEFGAWDGKKYSNSYNLVEKQGYSGVYIEADPERFKDLLATCSLYKNRLAPVLSMVVPKKLYIGDSKSDTLDNILANSAPSLAKNFDLLSIDIDSSDYQVWDSFTNYKPKIVIIEINSDYPPGVNKIHQDNVIPSGTSFTPMVELGRKKGYTLLLHVGNLIFIADEYVYLFPELTKINNSDDLYIADHRYVMN